MAVHVELPSRTIFELASKFIRGGIKQIFKLFGVLFIIAVFLAPNGALRADLPRVSGLLLGIILSVALLIVAYQKIFFTFSPIISLTAKLWWQDKTIWRFLIAQARQLVSGALTIEEVQAIEREAKNTAESYLDTFLFRQENKDKEADEVPEVNPDDSLLGHIVRDGAHTTVGMYLDKNWRNRHTFIIGKTGVGKTTLMKNLIVQDMERGDGVGFIDPHGDCAEELLGLIPDERIPDLLYFDPTDKNAPAFNPLILPFEPAKLTDDIISVFHMLTGQDSWGARMEHVLRFALMTLLTDSKQTHTVADLRTIFIDEEKRYAMIEGGTSKQVREFWDKEWPTMPSGVASPLLTRLSSLIAPMSDLERVFSQQANDLDFTVALNDRKILICNLAKGKIGDDSARLLGGMLVAGIQQSALARADMPEHERKDFNLYVDEFYNFTVASFESILAEARKYRLNLFMACQNLSQMNSSLRHSVFGNCGTMVAFQVSSDDSPALRKEMHRDRILVRTKGAQEFVTVTDFVKDQSVVYESALKDEYLGMSHAERSQYRAEMKASGDKSWGGAIESGRQRGQMMDARRAEIEKTNALLHAPTHDVKTLRELFGEYEFRDQSFPELDDFANCPPFHFFARVGSPQTVQCLKALKPDHPNTERLARVRAHLTAVHTQSLAVDSSPEVIPSAPENEIVLEEKKRDFWE